MKAGAKEKEAGKNAMQKTVKVQKINSGAASKEEGGGRGGRGGGGGMAMRTS